ncbi:class I SAM-dependent methyltransferase [Pedobacter duraquae]|nr:class I SAM-dependent methyltransferase [Pedobacter duraquae]
MKTIRTHFQKHVWITKHILKELSLEAMDIFGKALQDEYSRDAAYRDDNHDILWLHNSYGEPEEMPVDIFFRTEEEMPELELIALQHCKGKTLDIGAGAGSHALLLQQKNIPVVALDISKAAIQIMQDRGVEHTIEADLFKLQSDPFDTLLLLMNGIGITGSLDGFRTFLNQAKQLLNPGGQLIFDSSDISYIYEDTEKPTDRYFGQVAYQYEYQGLKGEWFNWVYLDQKTLFTIAEACGWTAELLFDDGEDQYLARLQPKDSI